MKRIALLLSMSTLLVIGEECNCANTSHSRAGAVMGQQSTLTFSVSGMSCGSCEKSLTDRLSQIHQLTIHQVSHTEKSVVVSFPTGKYNSQQIANQITKAGFLVKGEVLTFPVIGMSCSSCEKSLSAKITQVEGILSVLSASHTDKQLTVLASTSACKGTIEKAIKDAGFLVK